MIGAEGIVLHTPVFFIVIVVYVSFVITDMLVYYGTPLLPPDD